MDHCTRLVYLFLMLDAETINAGAKLVEAGGNFFYALGPVWSFCFVVVVCGTVLAWIYLRDRRHDKGWERALAAKA